MTCAYFSTGLVVQPPTNVLFVGVTRVVFSKRASLEEYSVLHGLENLEDVSQTITKGILVAVTSRGRTPLSNEKNHGWLGYIGDDILPSYIGIVINHYKDPYKPTSIMESRSFFSWLH